MNDATALGHAWGYENAQHAARFSQIVVAQTEIGMALAGFLWAPLYGICQQIAVFSHRRAAEPATCTVGSALRLAPYGTSQLDIALQTCA